MRGLTIIRCSAKIVNEVKRSRPAQVPLFLVRVRDMATEVACGQDWRLELLSDGELVLRARRGCEGAAEELLRRYRSMVRASARAFFMPGTETEDVIQEGMIGLIKAIRDYSVHRASTFRSFAELCVTRHLISAVKSACRNKHAVLSSAVSLNDSPDDCQENEVRREPPAPESLRPDRVLELRCLLGELRAAMDSELSKMEAAVLRGYLEGLSYTEIARRLGCTFKAVDNALQRARKKVAKRLAEVL